MSVTKTYSLNKQRQLVDLNGATTNFDLTWTVTSKDSSAFDVVVVDQATLDNNQNFQYKQANGSLSGNIISDQNVYQNYFLMHRAVKPTNVDVTINKKEIPPRVSRPKKAPNTDKNVKSENGFNWTLIGTIVIAAVLAVVVYMYIKPGTGDKGDSSIGLSSSSSQSVSGSSDVLSGPSVLASSSSSSAIPSVVPSLPSLGSSITGGINPSLLTRLNSLEF